MVAIGDVDVAAAEAAAAELGGGAIGLRLDVTDRPGFTAFLDEVERRLGPLDVLVNNAGIMPVSAARGGGRRDVIRQLEINLHAVIHGTKEAIRRMRPRGTGHIVNVASLAGKTGFPEPRHLLRHQARRRRALRGRAPRAPRHRRRGLGGDAGHREDRARRRPADAARLQARRRPRRSRPRSSPRSSSRASTSSSRARPARC